MNKTKTIIHYDIKCKRVLSLECGNKMLKCFKQCGVIGGIQYLLLCKSLVKYTELAHTWRYFNIQIGNSQGNKT